MENPEEKQLAIQNIVAELIRTDQDIRDLERQLVILNSWKANQQKYLDQLRR
jgi:hypothetical protein